MGKKNSRIYNAEFKEQAVRLATETSVKIAAERLGIKEGRLYSWKAKKKRDGSLRSSKANSEHDLLETPEQELKRLRKENEELKQVNYILKRATAVFSKDHLK
jgi:transposase